MGNKIWLKRIIIINFIFIIIIIIIIILKTSKNRGGFMQK
jgi:hypothetical protein